MTDRFPTENNFQGDLSKYFFPSNKFISAINAPKKSSPNKCKKYSCGCAFVTVFFNTAYLPWSINKR